MKKTKGKVWSIEEEQVIIDTMDWRSKEVAKKLNRTDSAIRMRRTLITQNGGAPVSTDTNEDVMNFKAVHTEKKTHGKNSKKKRSTNSAKESNVSVSEEIPVDSKLILIQGEKCLVFDKEGDIGKLVKSGELNVGDKIYEATLKFEVKAQVVHVK